MSDAPVNAAVEMVDAAEATEVNAVETTSDAVAEATAAEVTDDAAAKKADGGADKGAPAPLLKPTRELEQDRKKNNKFDPKSQEVTDDPVRIRKQVEFYLSDTNMATDEFLWNLTGGTENKPVPLQKICTFKRMAIFQPYTAVVAALKDSKFVDVEGAEGEETIKRKKPYVSVSDASKRRMASSVYAKGFGDEEPSTQFDLEAFFSRYGSVNSVRLRRTDDQLFKGSVFVEFADEETAKTFLALDPAPKWKEHDLRILSKEAYVKEKTDMIKRGEMEPGHPRTSFYEGKFKRGNGARGRGRGRGGFNDRRGDGDADDWKKRRDQDRKNGFKDHRGGRGRGRGGHGRGGRDRNDNRSQGRDNNNDGRPPVIQATDENGKVTKDDSTSKRSRDDDNTDAMPPAKKVDVKGDVAAEAS